MYDFDIVKVNKGLVVSIKLAVGVRRMLGKDGPGYEEVLEIERVMREGAEECQRVIECIKADGDRPLISD